jgi:hypothetical protein
MPQKNKRMSQYSTGVSDGGERFTQPIQRAYEQTGELVRHNPGSSALVTFGVGFGLGLVLTLLLAPPPRRQQTWFESHMPDWMSRERLSRAMSRVMPS